MQLLNNIIKRTDCCGLRELSPIGGYDPIDVLYTLAHSIRGRVTSTDGCYYVFTDNTGFDDGYGNALKHVIESENLGTIYATDWNSNPNSGNRLKAFLWTLDRPALLAWLERKLQEESATLLERAGFQIGDFCSL